MIPQASDNSFLLFKKFKCQYWNYTVSPSAGELYITPRFILFEYSNPSTNSQQTSTSNVGDDVMTCLPEQNKKKFFKQASSSILIPLSEIQQVAKSSYLLKSVLWIQTKNQTNYYFIGLKSITNTSTIINHVLDQLQIHEKKQIEIGRRKERPVELRIDENGFLAAIEYGEVSDEEEPSSTVIYSAKGKKIDPFSYIKSLTPSAFKRHLSTASEPSSSNAPPSCTNTGSNSFNYYLSGLYSYSVGPLVGLVYRPSSGKDETTKSQKNVSSMISLDHTSLEVLIKGHHCK